MLRIPTFIALLCVCALVGLAAASTGASTSRAATPPLVLAAPSTPVAGTCTLYAAPSGNDANPGTRARPVRTAQRLVDLLRAGSVGCLDSGTYATQVLAIRRGGTSSARVTLRSTPGQRALVRGQIWVAEAADHVTVAFIDHQVTFTGKPAPSPVVNGDDALFYGMDVSSPGYDTVCFFLGDLEWGVAVHTVIRANRIHNCGKAGANHRHGIYVAHAKDTVIEGNEIYANPDRGIQLYPHSVGALIRDNVIDGNGEGIIISGDYGFASSSNVIEHNVITNSRLRNDVESYWPEGNPVGTGNVVRGNCIFGGRFGPVQAPQVGFTATGNAFVTPLYVDRPHLDFGLRSDGPCAQFLATD